MITNKQEMWDHLVEKNPVLGTSQRITLAQGQLQRLVNYVWDKKPNAAVSNGERQDPFTGFDFLQGLRKN